MTRRLLSALFLTLLTIFALPAIASAHVLKVDGSIGGVLHINPDDNPTVGDSTDYTIAFDDSSGKFSLPKCDCGVAIIDNGKTIASSTLTNTNQTLSENHYTFTKAGVYTMLFAGKPKIAGAFQSFTLNYEVRVTGGQSTMQPMPVLLWVGMGMGVGLVLLAAFAMDYTTAEQDKERDI